MRLLFASFFATALVLSVFAEPGDSLRATASFDEQWRFLKGDPKAADNPTFNDSSWRQLNVPHDWSIEGPFSEKNSTGPGGAYLPAGVGWYRKHFSIPVDYAQRRVFLDFDGIMARSEVWINGTSLGKRLNGYVGFRCELTGRLNFGVGKTNVIAVRVDNARQPASRWYAGSGIYRHVRLVVTDPVHIAQSGVYITTPTVTSDRAVVHLQTSIINQSKVPREVMLHVDIFGPAGQLVQSAKTKPQVVVPSRPVDLVQDITVLKPQLWDTDHPNLYRLMVTLRSGSAALDNDVATFGFREARFEPLTGFFLNDRTVKLKGVCLHSDGGAFGAAVPLRVWERRLEQLKLIGCNAIRTTHNPAAPEFLDLCDRMGFLVIDEFFDCWAFGKVCYDYHLAFKDWAKSDLRDCVCRDRNHPSVILYSIGSEVRDVCNSAQAKKTLITLRDVCHQHDPTRPVTQALYRPDLSKDYKNGFADLLDVIGQNYRESDLMAAYAAKPTRKMIQTESGPDRKAWIAIRDNPACAGQFLWTGVDYLGDAQKWPWIGVGSGLLDRTSAPRPQAFERRAFWSDVPMVRIARRIGGPLPQPKGTNAPKLIDSGRFDSADQRQVLYSDWTPRGPRTGKETVEVYGNCQEIELFLNGKSLGSKPRAADDEPRVWMVPFEPGVIRAVGKNESQAVATHELRAAGTPAALELSADAEHLECNWDDVCQVRAIVVDSAGVPVPDATPIITFKVGGPGVLAAIDSASNATHELFQASERRAFNGQCVAMIKASSSHGKITISASSPGLPTAIITIN